MGLEIKHILSDKRHYEAFVCASCQYVVDIEDAMVTSICSHCFCSKCLYQWLNRTVAKQQQQQQQREQQQQYHHHSEPFQLHCPTCQTNLNAEDSNADTTTTTTILRSDQIMSMAINNTTTIQIAIMSLAKSQPLAFQLLQRIQVSCPLRAGGVDCHWQDDYSKLQSHLLSKDAHNNSNMMMMTTKTTTTTTKEDEKSSKDETNASSESSSSNNKNTTKSSNDYSSTSVTAVTAEQMKIKLVTAKSFKDEANSKFSSGHYIASRDLYSQAISILGSDNNNENDFSSLSTVQQKEANNLLAVLYSNRAAAQLGMKEYALAESDASMAVQHDKEYVKGYVRQTKALIQLGKFNEAVQVLKRGMQMVPKSKSILNKELILAKTLQDNMTQGLKLLEQREYASAKAMFGRVMLETNAIHVLLNVARSDLGLGLTDSVSRLTRQILKENNTIQATDAYLIRGQCLVFIGNSVDEMESGIKLIRQAMRLDPDSKTGRATLKECVQIVNMYKSAKEKKALGQYELVVENLTTIIDKQDGIAIVPPKAPLFTKLLMDRATASLRLEWYSDVLKDTNSILSREEDNVDAILLKVEALHGVEKHQEALDEITTLLQTKPWAQDNEDLKQAHETAERKVRQQNRPNFYKLLGVTQLATEKEIRKAYKIKALEFHPDRMVGDGYTDEQRKKAESDFHLLGDALEYLTDAYKRRLYDMGYDMDDIKERAEAQKQAANMRSYYGGADPFANFY